MAEMWLVVDGSDGIYAICDFEHQAKFIRDRLKTISLFGLKLKRIFINEGN